MPVYMIRCGESGPVKIGYGSDPQKRLCDLQIAHWETLVLIRMFKGGEAEEAALHVRFADLHIRGEWHAFSRQMMGDVGLTEIIQAPVEPDVTALVLDDAPSARQIGERLRSLRKSRGLSQARVADALGLSRSSVAELEGGQHFPVLSTLLRASKFFGVPVTMKVAA